MFRAPFTRRSYLFDDPFARRKSAVVLERSALSFQFRQRDEALLPYGDDFGGVLLRGRHGVWNEQSQRPRHDEREFFVQFLVSQRWRRGRDRSGVLQYR